ncbi:plasmid maintenance protein (plasmid) [Borrelia recurrentis]|uniref:Plasmid partioning associated protein 2 n=1 Tax=Borrelia recurrentis (strain A1) TaxID=412418 RepID=B5RS03_BORRA|nr:plasmid maintenance protein [Borrelia recurrentis]ACH95139.1 plasmid partioning associated protein 2 [Borrelia recurrentis A1]
MEIKKIKGKTNRYQYNLIVLISTLNFMNLKLKQYTQTNILYFFNGNLTRNKQQKVKIKTLQNYLYELEKKYKITLNYCKHLGKQCGSEIYYKLKYPKKTCHTKINQYFRNIKKEKIDKFTKRIETYIQENGSPKWECINNINNNKKIEERILKKYISKCHFKIDLPLVLLNSKIEKDLKIELIKEIKKYERAIEALSLDEINLLKGKLIEGTPNCVKGFLEGMGYLKNIESKIKRQEIKQKELKEILDLKRKELESQNYKEDVLNQEINKIYERYKNKPHFIIEQDKYRDLDLLIQKIKKNTEKCKSKTKERDDIKNNIFSILLEQLRHKFDIGILVPTLKKFINAQDELKYSKVVDNTYYYELLDTIK